MIEMLKIEEKKKKGGIGIATKTKPSTETAGSSKTDSKPTASELLQVKLRKKENIEKKTEVTNSSSRTVTIDKTSKI